MKSRSKLFYFLALVVILAAALAVSAMSSSTASPRSASSAAYQATIVPTVGVGVTPPVVVVTGVVPVTGQPAASPNWFFLTILVVAGLAFLVAIAALLRRPYE
jgi:hypothetical protein